MSGYKRCAGRECGAAFISRRGATFCPECRDHAARVRPSLVDAFEREAKSLPSAGTDYGDERGLHRIDFFDALGPEFQQAFWKSLGDEVGRAREQLRLDRNPDDVPVRRSKAGKRWAEQGRRAGSYGFVQPRTNLSDPKELPGRDHGDDPLHDISPFDYVPLLTGTTVPTNGIIRCPLHDDRTPSLKVYPDHWHCFGCSAGGDIYALAAALWGRELRGDDFLRLRRELARTILGVAA